MTRIRLPAPAPFVALALLAATAGAVAAQEVAGLRSHAPPSPAWLGIGYEVRWVQGTGLCEPRVVVESVVQGSPAERAGIRPGDAIVALDGTEMVGADRLQIMSAHLAPGDPVRLRIARDGSERLLTAVADRRPDRPPTAVLPPKSPGYRGAAPLIRVRGDTIEAVNLEALHFGGQPNGYWLVSGGEEPEYRRISSWSTSPLDERVTELLECARTRRRTDPISTITRVSASQIHERAESLRVAIARRALVAQPPEPPVPARAAVPEMERGAPPAAWVYVDAPGVHAFELEEHVAKGFRGVAGAELTRLEPELADYFRGAREGLLVLRVGEGSPAERAGLRPGDVITAADGRSVDSVERLRTLLSLPDPTPLELKVVRHGRDRTIRLRRD